MKSNRQRGFSLMELMVVVGILTLIMAVVFTTIAHVQTRSNTEAQRVDVTQGVREVMDQIDRDLRNSGYPRAKMYDPALVPAATDPSSGAALGSPIIAAGMIAVSATEIRFEGDIDGSGTVSSVGYRVVAGPGNKCPCVLQRSVSVKISGGGIGYSSYQDALGDVINSTGSGAWSLSGTAPNGVANDVVYSGFKRTAVFQYFDKNNNSISVPSDLTGGINTATAQTVASVAVTVNVLSPLADRQTGLRSGTSMQTSVNLANVLNP